MIIKAYAEWGTAAVERFAGIFAIAIAERDSGRLVLIRDRLGIKPLYVNSSPDKLPIRIRRCPPWSNSGAPRYLDRPCGLLLRHDLPLGRAIAPDDPQRNRKAPPATVCTVNPDGSSTDSSTGSHRSNATPTRLPGTAHNGLRRCWTVCALPWSVEWRRDVPFGVLLSGGIDSSVVVAILLKPASILADFQHRLRIRRRNRATVSSTPIVAHQFGTKHHRIEISSSRLLPAIDGAVTAMSEPMVP